jgi:hypothetical protein
LSNSGGRNGVQGSVADVEALAGVQQVDPVQWQRPLGGHDPDAQERRHHAGVGGGVQEVEQSAGVIAVWVGEPDPADVRRVDDQAECAYEVAVRQAKPGVDDYGL